MFATRKDLEEWCSSFLEKNAAGQYVCPFDKAQLSLIKEKGYWKISGKNELWLWDGTGVEKFLYPASAGPDAGCNHEAKIVDENGFAYCDDCGCPL